MQITRREAEPFEAFLGRYKRSFASSGILRDLKRHRYYLSPSESRRLKEKAAERRRRRRRRPAD